MKKQEIIDKLEDLQATIDDMKGDVYDVRFHSQVNHLEMAVSELQARNEIINQKLDALAKFLKVDFKDVETVPHHIVCKNNKEKK